MNKTNGVRSGIKNMDFNKKIYKILIAFVAIITYYIKTEYFIIDFLGMVSICIIVGEFLVKLRTSTIKNNEEKY